MSDSPDTNNILYFSFNQDSSCFAIGTEKGFGIFNTYPFLKTVERSKILFTMIRYEWRNRNN